MQQPNVLDIFAGCGGLSLGLSQAGWNIVAANEIDQWASDTYRLNHPNVEHLLCDVRNLSTEYLKYNFAGLIDLVVGGPPCQGFSVSGKRQYGHIKEQNQLVSEYIRVIRAVRPKMALLENVGGFRTGHMQPGNPVMKYLEAEFSELGYELTAKVLQAADFGVASLRSRVFVVASRIGLSDDVFPKQTHARSATKLLKRHVSVWDAIGDLPEVKAAEGQEGPVSYASKPLCDYQRRLRQGSNGVYNHVAMKHTPPLVERFKALPQGGSGYGLGRSDAVDIKKQVTIYKSNNQRLVADLPSLCITANFQSTYVHPYQPRNLTAREGARLMGYLDSFVFLGKRTQMSSSFLKKYGREHEDFLSQYNQIGNSVPPPMAKEIGRTLLEFLERHSTRSPANHKSQIAMVEVC